MFLAILPHLLFQYPSANRIADASLPRRLAGFML